MLNIKTILLCSVVSASALSMSTMAQADGLHNIGGYVEFGTNVGLTNFLGVQTKKEENLVTLERPGFSPNGALGVRYHNFDLGLDVSHFTANTQYSFTGKSLNQPSASEEWGDLAFTTFITKLGFRYNYNENNAIYVTTGFGAAVYTRSKTDKVNEKNYFPTANFNAPAFLMGFGYKRYFGGVYALGGIKYTRLFNKDLHLRSANHEVHLKSGLGAIQVELKLGYDFGGL